MARKHMHCTIFSRARRVNTVLKAACRAGTTLYDERRGITYSFRHKTEVVVVGILAPEGAPAWVHDRQTLWNRVEQQERRRDSQLARQLEVTLPPALSIDEQRALLVAYLEEHFVRHGMVADFAIHAKPGNPHAHVMLTMRALGPEGFGPKMRTWNERSRFLGWRQAWEDCALRACAHVPGGMPWQQST